MKVSLVVAAGIVLIVGGLIALVTNSTGTDAGWFAYDPDDGGIAFGNGALLLTPADQVCLVVVGVGVAVLAGACGFVLGRRRAGAGDS